MEPAADENVSSPGASSSQDTEPPSYRRTKVAAEADKRELSDKMDETETPEQFQKISSVCIGHGAADKIGEIGDQGEYEEDLRSMAREYQERDEAGEFFVHVRKRYSSNKDLRALNVLTGRDKFYKINLRGGEAESVITNSLHLVEVIREAECESCEDIESAISKRVKGDNWESDKIGFEQHMLSEGSIRVDWKNGKFETEKLEC